MSEVKVNKISPRSGTNIELGDSGDTVTVSGNVVKTNAIQASDAGNIISQSGTTNTIGATGDVIKTAVGTTKLEIQGDGSSEEGKIQLNCHVNSHGVVLQSPPHSSGQSYTIKLPDNQIAADKFIKIKSITGSGSTAVGQAEFADAGGGQKTLLSTTTLSSTSNVIFNNSLITSTYRDYYISFSNVHVSSDGTNSLLRFSTDNGSSFNADALYHRTTFGIASDGSTIYKNVATNETQFNLNGALTTGNGTGENFSLRLYLFNPLGTDNYKHISGVMSSADTSGNANQFVIGGYWKNAADDVDAIRIEPSSGTYASGTVKFYGIN